MLHNNTGRARRTSEVRSRRKLEFVSRSIGKRGASRVGEGIAGYRTYCVADVRPVVRLADAVRLKSIPREVEPRTICGRPGIIRLCLYRPVQELFRELC